MKLLFTCDLYLRVRLTLFQRGNHSGPSLDQFSLCRSAPSLHPSISLQRPRRRSQCEIHWVRGEPLFFCARRRPRVGTASGASLKPRRSQKRSNPAGGCIASEVDWTDFSQQRKPVATQHLTNDAAMRLLPLICFGLIQAFRFKRVFFRLCFFRRCSFKRCCPGAGRLRVRSTVVRPFCVSLRGLPPGAAGASSHSSKTHVRLGGNFKLSVGVKADA